MSGVGIFPGAVSGESGPGNVPLDLEQRQRADALVAEGLELLAERKWEQAQNTFRAAQLLHLDNGIQILIDRLTQRQDLDATAAQATANIQTVLDDGDPEVAAKLAGEALQHFDATESAPALVKLKRQADALRTVRSVDHNPLFERAKDEFQQAMRADNKQFAMLALEQAMRNGDEKALQEKYDHLVADIDRCEQLRRRAAQLRRDPGQLGAALDALKEALKLWDSAVVRRELDECELQLHFRRDRLAVAEFEVRGEVGVPGAGALIADEMSSSFKRRFSVVERGQVNKVIEELKVRPDLAEGESVLRQVGRLAGVRYLVIGIASPVNGLTVNARLIEAETGLIVRTAKLAAQTRVELIQRLPRLAAELMMNDDETPPVAPGEVTADRVVQVSDLDRLPPPPALPADDDPPPAALIPARLTHPPFGDLKPQRFDDLLPPPPGQPLSGPAIPAVRDLELRRRSLVASVELGDNYFRRGLFREALRCFEFAVTMFPERSELRLRVERCRPLASSLGSRPATLLPRLAALDFLVAGSPAVVPPHSGFSTPEMLSAYLAGDFDVVDRSEVFWWMGRLGLTTADLLNDPAARQYLGRALNVQQFLMGMVAEASGVTVSGYVVDAQYGQLTAAGRIRLRQARELKFRIPELAWLLRLSPEEARGAESDSQWALLINDLRVAVRDTTPGRVFDLCRKGLRLRPANVELRVILVEAARQARATAAIEVLRRELTGDQQSLVPVQVNRLTFASLAEAEGARARRGGAARSAAERERRESQRRVAAANLTSLAGALRQRRQFGAAATLCESAAALQPNDDRIYREVALAEAGAQGAQMAEPADEHVDRNGKRLAERRDALVRAQQELVADRQRREAEDKGRRNVRDERVRAEHLRMLDQAQQYAANQQHDEAFSSVQMAKELRTTPEAERLLTQLMIERLRSAADRRGPAARAELDRQLATEREARQAAEAHGEMRRQLYDRHMADAQKALSARKLDEAEEQFFKAGRILETDAVAVGIREVKSARSAGDNAAGPEKPGNAVEAKIADARVALEAGKHDKAVALFLEARQMGPLDTTMLAGLAKAEHLRDLELAKARRAADDQRRLDTFTQRLESGKRHLAAQEFTAAGFALRDALELDPDNREAKASLAQAETLVKIDQETAARYAALMRDGRRFLAARQYGLALQDFAEARNIAPSEKAAGELLDRSLKARDLGNYLAQFRAALIAGKLESARNHYAIAAKIEGNHPDVVKAGEDLRNAQSASSLPANKSK